MSILVDKAIIKHILMKEIYSIDTMGIWVKSDEVDGSSGYLCNPSTDLNSAYEALEVLCKRKRYSVDINKERPYDDGLSYTTVTFKGMMGEPIQSLGNQLSPSMAICEALLDNVDVDFEEIVGYCVL